MKAIATINTGSVMTKAGLGKLLVIPRGVDVSRDVPLLDSHNLKNPPLGHVVAAWFEEGDTEEDDTLQAELAFDDTRSGRRSYGMLMREELTGVSSRLEINRFTVHTADGRQLSDDEALEMQDDPGLVFCVRQATLLEVSLCLTPTDPRARARAIGLDAEAWRMIKQGERELARILRPDRDDVAGGDYHERVMADLRRVRFGEPEMLQARHDDDDDDRGLRSVVMPDRRLIRYGAAELIT